MISYILIIGSIAVFFIQSFLKDRCFDFFLFFFSVLFLLKGPKDFVFRKQKIS